MARPTEEKKERTVKLRISEELYGEIASKGRNLSETIREILRNSFVPQNNSEKNQKSGLTPNKDLEEIDSMAKFFGMDGGELLKGVCDGLMDGNLTVENGKVVGVPEINLEKLEEACHERGIGMQEAIDKTVKSLRSGK